MSEKLKKLTSKNPKDFEEVAYSLINSTDVELFKELTQSDDFLFDFVKQNVIKRLEKVCNQSNFRNLISFLKYYCGTYEEFIISTLAKYADDDLTDTMLKLFENGSDDEKTYCAKYFEYVHNPSAVPILNKYAFASNSALSTNCASTLAKMNENSAYNKAFEMLKSNDDFEKLDGVKFLIAFGNKNAVNAIVQTMKSSAFAENIASELPYLKSLFELYQTNPTDALYTVNLIINALGEVADLSQVFDFELYEFLEMLINKSPNSQISAVLLNALERFETLTENDEYLFDQQKETKQEIFEIKKLLQKADIGSLYSLIDEELNANSLFVYTAIDFSENEEKIRTLLTAPNPTITLKAIEALKQMEVLTEFDRQTALNNVSDDNVKNIISAT